MNRASGYDDPSLNQGSQTSRLGGGRVASAAASRHGCEVLDDLISPHRAATLLGCDEAFVLRRIYAGTLPAVRLPYGRLIVPEAAPSRLGRLNAHRGRGAVILGVEGRASRVLADLLTSTRGSLLSLHGPEALHRCPGRRPLARDGPGVAVVA
jgi:hypothetical protein